jgi:antitoxin HicB
MQFPARLATNGEGGFIVTFPDVDDALTEGASREEALANAADALEVALLGRMKDGEDIPAPSGGEAGALVPLSAQIAAKVAFYTAFRESGLSRSALARRLGKDEAEVRRMLDPHHATKLPALDEGIRALGRRLTVELEPAA